MRIRRGNHAEGEVHQNCLLHNPRSNNILNVDYLRVNACWCYSVDGIQSKVGDWEPRYAASSNTIDTVGVYYLFRKETDC